MKRILALLSVLVLIFACSFSGSLVVSAEENDLAGESIVVYNWGEYISNGDDDSLDVIKDFTKKTGIKVTYLTFASNEELYTKLKSGSASYDVIIISDYMISKLIGEDMLLPIDFDNVPNYQYIDKALLNNKAITSYDPEQSFSIPYTWGRVALLYNKKYVTEEIDSWGALWDEKYSNKILMFDNSRDAFGLAQLLNGDSFNSTDPEVWEKAAELLKKQKPLVRSYVMDQIFPMMSSGEAALAPYYIGDALTIMSENEDVGFAFPKEGTNVFVDAMCIPKGCKNKAAAEAFINYMCSYEAAKANAEYLCYSSPQTQVIEGHKEYLSEEFGEYAVEATYPDSLDGCEAYINLDDATNKLQTDLWLEVRAGSNYTRSVICVCTVMALLIGGVIIAKIKKYRRDKFIYS